MEDHDLKFTQTRESLEFALESGKMATWEIDLESNQVSCSKEMLDLWGIDPHEFKNHRSILQNKVYPSDRDRMNTEINDAIKRRSIYELEYRIIPSPGQIRWVCSRGRCTFAPGSDKPVRFAGIVYDITEKKVKEIELANAQKARSDFLTIAGHELKTPLTCLQLQLNVMESQLQDLSKQDSSAELIAQGLKKQQDHLLRISKIINNILDETKISEGLFLLQFENCNLADIVSEIIEQLKLTATSHDVELILKNPMPILGKWDRFRLEQVLLNLLMNAIRYGNKKPIHVEVVKEKDKALVIIRDQGIGISPEDQSRVFQRFVRLNQDPTSNGMGLGLYISNYIIRAHGGEIRLKSEFGKGSEFTVAIPCS